MASELTAGPFTPRRRSPALFVLLWLLVAAGLPVRPAHAYRPFNQTDVAVVDGGQLEIECGPVGLIVDEDGRTIVAPALILNFGLTDRWELVVEGRHFFLLDRDAARRHSLRDTAISVKHVLRRGVLQDRTGPSIGLEAGLLLPGVGVDPGVGASLAGIVSQRWSDITLHVNGSLELTHEQRLAGAVGTIVEGPSRWTIRPVGELLFEADEVIAVSGLAGAIWRLGETFSLDAGWQIARADGEDQREFRAGFTWTVPLGASRQAYMGLPLFSASQPRTMR